MSDKYMIEFNDGDAHYIAKKLIRSQEAGIETAFEELAKEDGAGIGEDAFGNQYEYRDIMEYIDENFTDEAIMRVIIEELLS